MAARNTFAATRRSHAILHWLQAGESVTIQRVCDVFKIQYPQAREDLKLLEDLYNLRTHREGRTKIWSWSGPERAIKTVAAAAALELGAIALDMFRNTPYGEEIDKISSECRRGLNKEHDERVGRISSALHLRRTWLPTDADGMLESVEEVLDAIYLDRLIQIDYERADGGIRSYDLIPHRLIWYGGRLWLQASDQDTYKLFDVAGIQKIRSTGKRLSADEEALDLSTWDGKTQGERKPTRNCKGFEAIPVEEYFANAFGIFTDNYPVASVLLSMSGSWATYFRRYRVHPSQQNHEKTDSLHVELTLGICPEFKSFLMGMIPNVQILQPRELKQELRTRAALGAAM